MAIIKISEDNGGVWAEEATPDPRAYYVGEEMLAELAEINSELAALELEPDEIPTPNDSKFFRVQQLEERKIAINNIILN